jgi:hypothetical protein
MKTEFSNSGTSLDEKNVFSFQLKNILIILSGFAIFLMFLVPQITGLKIAEISSFYTEDSHCVEVTALTKIHCFGDFGYAIEIVRSGKSVWNNDFSNPYPPINFQLYLFFSYVAWKVGYLFSLVLYLISLIAAMTIPFLHALKKEKPAHKILVISTCVFASLPFLIVLDRGNNNVWSLPFIYFFIAARYDKVPKKYDFVFAALAIAFRPQNLILIAIFLSNREFKKIVKTLSLSSLISILSFIAWDFSKTLSNMKDQIDQIIRYSSGIPGIWPPSLSFSRGLKTITEIFDVGASDWVLKNIGYAIGALLIIKLLILKNKYQDSQILILTLPLIFLLPALSWYYYASVLLVILATTFLLGTTLEEVGLGSKKRGYLFLTAMVVTMSPICLPIWEGQYNVVQVFVPIIWILTYLAFLIGLQKKIDEK